MAIFNLISDPDLYNADTWDIGLCPDSKAYWLSSAIDSFDHILDQYRHEPVEDRLSLDAILVSAKKAFKSEIDMLYKKGDDVFLSISLLDEIRFQILEQFKFHDPYLKLKASENISASKHYHRLITAHDKLPSKQLVKVLTQGIFAGNIFDMGQRDIINKIRDEGGLDFYKTMNQLPKRPWCVDDYDQWSTYYLNEKITRVMIFVDNAGSDFILGCLPLARQLAKMGATVFIIANDLPASNDITVNECKTVVGALTRDDEMLGYLLQTRRIRILGSGGHLPQVRLDEVSDECNDVTNGVNLLVFVGMGRSLETNYHTKFKCPTLKLAMLKSDWHAEQFNGNKYDVVCKFEQP